MPRFARFRYLFLRRRPRGRRRRRIRTRWLVRGAIIVLCILIAPALAILPLRWLPPPTTAFMLQSESAVDYRWTDWEDISPNIALAVIAAEDQRFPDHWGFDLESIKDAVVDYQATGRSRGASTISQQVAKNLFLWPGRSFVRKGIEAYLTVWIELLWPKRRILEVHLNIAEFGPGIYGVEPASQTYFMKPARAIRPWEAATLAAVLPNPKKLRADRPSRYVRERRDWILEQSVGLGGVSYLTAL